MTYRQSQRRSARPAALVLLLCLPLLALATRPVHSGTLDPGSVKETVFPSGLRLLVKEAHSTELASVQVWIRAGGFREDEKTAGTAHVIEHLIFKGSESGGPGSIDEEIENLGGLLEASTEKDWTKFGCTVAGRYVGKTLAVVGDALRKPRFRQEDFEAEKPVILEEIQQARSNPESGIAMVLYDLAFQKHPYKYDVRGTPEFLKSLDLKAVQEYYRKHYIPANMTVVVVGDVDAPGVERAVRTAFAADQPGPKADPTPLPPDERACETPERRSVNTTFQNGYVGLAFPAPSVKDEPDVYAMDVLITLLEHQGSGRLPLALKETAGVNALFETRRQPGLTVITAATGETGVETVERTIMRELELIGSRPVSAEELNLAKRQLRGSYALDNETYAGQGATLGYYTVIDNPQFAVDYLRHVDQVTAEQVQAIARKYLDPQHCVSVLLKPRQRPGPEPRPGA